MAGKRIEVSLVLGSGGARGLAHIGVIRALQETGRFEVRAITGTSIGALIGGLHACDKLDAYADWVRGLSRLDVWGLLDFSFTSKGLFEGERVMKKLADLLGEVRIEDLPVPFTAVASDIEKRQEVWLNDGSLFTAIRASIAVPGLFTPVERDGRLLVDGGLMSPLPLAPTLGHDADQTIAVSLNGASPRKARGRESGGDAVGVDRQGSGNADPVRNWFDRARRILGLESASNSHSESDPDSDSRAESGSASAVDALDIIAKSVEAMQDRIARFQIAAYRPAILIEIPVDACGILDFHRADEMIELGYREARSAFDRFRPG